MTVNELMEKINVVGDTLPVNLFYENGTCSGIIDSRSYSVSSKGDYEIAWIGIDSNRLKSAPVLNIGLYGRR